MKPKQVHRPATTRIGSRLLYEMASPLLVCSIDFGTTYSGWAISFSHEFKSEPTKGFVKQWHSGGSIVTEKTPTVVLVQPDGKTLEAFGYDAENRYMELAEEKKHTHYYYFLRFKMKLHTQLGEELGHMTTIRDEMGRPLPALDVFSMAIKFLVNDMHTVVKDKIAGAIHNSEVHWVITVPAIWSASAKQFMRNASELAGISPEKLTIALEPEAASLFCRHLPMDKRVDNSGVSISSFSTGTKYMVLDAGGGTIDVTVHEVERSGAIKEIAAASGGGWGGILVDQAFEKLVIDLVDNDSRLYQKFKQEHMEDWLYLCRDFETKKRYVCPDKDTKIVMRLPVSLIQMYEKKHPKISFKDAVKSSEYGGDIEFGSDKMKFNACVFKKLFEVSISKTIQHIESLLHDPKVREIKAILMVGGFSESPMLQQKVKSSFHGIDMIIPSEASSSIMRGALIYGHSPKSISERVLQYTYGVEVVELFKEGIHPPGKRVVIGNVFRCKDVFSKHVERNQIVKVGEPQVRNRYGPCYKDQQQIELNVYASKLKNPQYTDEGCKLIGKMTVNLSDTDGDLDRNVWVKLTFSGTEIEVESEDENTGETTNVTLNFLG